MNPVLKSWNQSAPHWARYHDAMAAMFAPITEAMIEAADLAPSHRVLDVAGGSGEPTLTLAGRAQHVTHSDAVADMVEAARATAQRRGLDNVAFVQACAESLPFEDATFDRVFCRLGMMFFEDPREGVREMLRVLRPDGRLCVVTWDGRPRNPFFEIPLQALARYVDIEDAFHKGALRFEDPEGVRFLLESAGARDPQVRVVPFIMRGTMDFEAWLTLRTQLSSTMRDGMAALTPAQGAAVHDDIEQAMRGFFDEAGFAIPASVIVAVGNR